MQKIRLAIVVSHPIQYYVPFYRAIARDQSIELRVFFCSRIGIDRKLDPMMGVEMSWNMDLTGGFGHEFLPEAERISRVSLRDINNPSVTAALAKWRPDALLVHGYSTLTALRALFWCGKRRIPVLMTSDSSTHSSGPGMLRHIKMATLPLLLRQYTAFLTMSERSEAYLQGFGVSRTLMFRTPMMVPELFWEARERRAVIRAEWRARLGLGEEDLALLFVGKLYAGKRLHDVIDALARIAAMPGDRPRIRLVVAGDGEARHELEARAKAAGVAAQFLGFVNIDKLPDYYCAADILVHPAELEQYGMVVLEAAVLGLPIVVSDRVGAIGATSIARPGNNAADFACGDVSALAAIFQKLAAAPAERQRMAEASLRISLEHGGPASVASLRKALETSLASGRDDGADEARPHRQADN
jgi:glycosyltransferase involved in cell wall biosynthesis